MFKKDLIKDNIWIGLIVGLVFPAIAYFFVEVLKKNLRIMEKDDLLYIGCVAINLFIVRFLFKKNKENTARGIVASTFICAFIFFMYKVRH